MDLEEGLQETNATFNEPKTIWDQDTKQDRMALSHCMLRRLSFICFFLKNKLSTVDDKIVSPLFVTTSSVTKYQNREDHRSSMNKKHPKEYLSI